MSLPNLSKLAMKRYEISSLKCSNQNLINHELSIHQNTINEYLSLYDTIKINNNGSLHLHLQNFINQPYIDANLRIRMIDTLITSHFTLRLSTPTLFHSILIMDQISCNFIIKDYNYKLIALVALWISSKFYDLKRRVPHLSQLYQLTQYRYDKQEFCSMELIILNNLNWELFNSMDTLDTCIDSILFPFLSQLGNNINNLKIWFLIISELCMFDVYLSMQFNSMDLIQAIFPIVLKINNNNSNKKIELTLENNILTNKILKYIYSLNGNFPFSIETKYNKNILFYNLKNYFQYYEDPEYYDPSLPLPPPPTTTKTINTPVGTSREDKFIKPYSLPMTPTTPNHLVSQKPVQENNSRKNPICDADPNEEIHNNDQSATVKRARI